MSKPDSLTKVEDILAKLVSFDTTSRNSNRPLIDFVRDYLDTLGVSSEIVDDNGKACLWATVGAGVGGIALAGHTDTVPIEDQNWSSNPFHLVEREGKLYARGAVDMKGFIACALAFAPEFLAEDRGCFHLALTCDEEVDMSGALRLTDHLKGRGVKPAWTWIGEPTELAIVDQHKGVSAYRTTFTGVTGHSGKPAEGLNALELAMLYMQVITHMAHEKEGQPFNPSRFDPPFTTFNLATIAGGTAENIIPGSCDLLWQMRAYPGEAANEMMAEIERRATEVIAPRLAPFLSQASMRTCTCFDIPPFLGGADNAGTQAMKRALQCDETQAAGFATEAGIFQSLGAGAVVCGPGSIDQAHQPNEYIDKNQLAACVDLMRRVLLSSFAS